MAANVSSFISKQNQMTYQLQDHLNIMQTKLGSKVLPAIVNPSNVYHGSPEQAHQGAIRSRRENSNSVRGVGQMIAGISTPGSSYMITGSKEELHNVPYEMQSKNQSKFHN